MTRRQLSFGLIAAVFAVTLTLIGTEVLFRSIDFPFDEEDFVNVRPFIKEKLGIIHKFSSSDLADILGFKERKRHDALSDALVIAKTLIELRWGSNL